MASGVGFEGLGSNPTPDSSKKVLIPQIIRLDFRHFLESGGGGAWTHFSNSGWLSSLPDNQQQKSFFAFNVAFPLFRNLQSLHPGHEWRYSVRILMT